MPRLTFSSEHLTSSPFDYPKLTLEKAQKALVLVFDRDPLVEYVHTLNMPELGPDNGPIWETSTTPWGKEQTKAKTTFVGKHICLGDFEKLSKGVPDAAACPSCEEAAKTDMVSKAIPRYAAHVGVYQTKPNSFEVIDPFSVSIKAWVFGEKVFKKLVEVAEEWDDLRAHDLKLGPCESKLYQKFEISVSAQAEWRKSAEREKTMAEAFQNNQSPDLTPLIARKNTRAQVEEDVAKIVRQNSIAFGGSRGREEEPVTTDSVAAGMDMDGLLSGGQSTPEQPTEAKQDKAPAATLTKKKETVGDLEDLFDGI